MNSKQIACGGCGFYSEKSSLHKNKDGKSYCENCRLKIFKAPLENKSLNQEDFDKLLKALWNTPPLRLKDLKEQLKKERDKKKRKTKDKRDSK